MDSTDIHSDPVWKSIREYQFDRPDAHLKFTSRLARENNWSIEFAHQVVDEYRKFCYLACVADHPVTPSDEIDQAWHLHLIYSEMYRDFCARVLKTRLDHGPTLGGNAEAARFREQYAATLNTYQKVFGCPPSPGMWPPATERFASAGRFVRVNRSKYWVLVPPDRIDLLLLAGGIAGLAIISLA